jgi:hypothetical protein
MRGTFIERCRLVSKITPGCRALATRAVPLNIEFDNLSGEKGYSAWRASVNLSPISTIVLMRSRHVCEDLAGEGRRRQTKEAQRTDGTVNLTRRLPSYRREKTLVR